VTRALLLALALLGGACKRQPRDAGARRRGPPVSSRPAAVLDVRAEHLAVWRAVRTFVAAQPAGSIAAELDIQVAGDTGSTLLAGQAEVRLGLAQQLGVRGFSDLERHRLTLVRSGTGYSVSADEITDPSLRPPSSALTKAFPRRIPRPERPALTLSGDVVLTVHFSPADDLLQLELRGPTGVRVHDLGGTGLERCIAEPPEAGAWLQLGCNRSGHDTVWLHVDTETIRVERNINVCPQCAGLMFRRVPVLRVAVPPGTHVIRAFSR